MSRDFTLEKYSELMLALMAEHKVMTVSDYLTMPGRDDSVAVIRHDVLGMPERAARMALLEKRLGVRSTYYFGWDPKATYWGGKGDERLGNFPELQVTEAKLYGHEVGYIPREGEDAASRLARLRALAPVRSAISQVSDDDILGGPFSPEFSGFISIVNEGKRWSGPDKLKGTDSVIEYIKSKKESFIMLSVDPGGWK